MDKIFDNKALFINLKETKDFKQLASEVYLFSQGLKELKISKIEIFAEDIYLFLVAFLGAILTDSEIYILSKNISKDFSDSYFNDEKILKIAKQKHTGNLVQNTAINLEKRFYIQTSGSSGEKKAIVKNVKQMLLEAQQLQKQLNITSKHSFFQSVSHQHLYGLTFGIFLPLVSGAKIFCYALNYPEVIVKYLKENPTQDKLVFISSPILLETIAQLPYLEEFKNIEKIIAAGSKLNPKVHQFLLEKLKSTSIIEIYGSTETGIIAYNLGKELRLFKGVYAFVNEQMRLIVKSPWLNEMNFLTNDCAEIKGRKLKLMGRYDRIIKFHDRRVGLEGVENSLETNKLVEKAYVHQDKQNNHLAAIIVLNQEGKNYFRKYGKKGIVSQLNTSLKENFANVVRYFYIKDKIPYDAQGKVSKTSFFDYINERKTPKFELLQKEESFLKAKAYIAEDCFYFTGHFLNFPLVPGFVELGFVFQLLERYFNLSYHQIKHIENVKFMNFLRPLDILYIELTLRDNKIYFSLFANDIECSKGRLRIM
ncbi:MAG: AMP-binding protein [Helicobacter sp.]|nr:AMP-binding protein [Helicobacter sp.]